jgi:hypothetical protein
MYFNDSATNGASITELFIEAVKSNEVRHCSDPENLAARLQEFTAFRANSRDLHSTFNPVSPA